MRLHPDKWLDLTGKTGLDCWGLARTIFGRLGVDVGFRLDSSDDWQQIPTAEPGALVMIGATHCGVALDAEEFIHVRQGEAVAVASLRALKRAGKLSGIYRHLGRVTAPTFDPAAPGTVRVVHIAHPVDRPHERVSHVIPWTHGMTIGAIAPAPSNVVMTTEGPVPLDRATCVPVVPGATVLFITAPGEFTTATGALTALGVFSIGLGVSLLSIGLQALLAPRPSTDAREESSPAFDLSGLRNTATVGIAQPVIYGTRRAAGNLISAYQQVDANGSASLYLLLFLSRGPIQSIGGLTADADDLRGAAIPTTIEIDGNAASNYDCSVSVRLGNSDQDPIPGFGDIITAYAQTPTLAPSVPFTYSTVGEVDGFDVELTFPSGLVDVTNSGSFANRTVKFYVRHRVTGTTTWTEETWMLTEARASSFVRQFSKRGLTRDRYEIQIERYPGDGVISAPWPESAPKFFSQSNLSTINEVTSDLLTYPGKALLAVKIRATEQLSGSIPTVTALVEGRKVWLWDGLSTTAPDFGTAETFSDNPAWCALDKLLNKEYGIGRSGRMTLDQIDLDSFSSWADHCDALVDDGRGSTVKRATCNAIFDSVGSAWGNFLDIARGAWAEPYIAGNKVRIALLADSSAVFLFGSGNAREVTITTLGRSQRPNAVEVQYFNEEANYDADSAKRVDEAAIFTNGEPENVETVGTVGVTNPAQAYRLAAFRRNWHRLVKQRATWVGGPDSLHLLPGDAVALVAPGVFDGVAGRTVTGTEGNNDEIAFDRAVTCTDRVALRIQHPATGTIETAYISAGVYARGYVIGIEDSGGAPTTWATIPDPGTPYVIESLSAQASRRLFRLESIEEGQRQDRTFVATTHDSDIYDDDFGDLEDFTDALPNVRAIPSSVARLSVVEVAACDCSALSVTFDPINAWDRAEVWYRTATTTEGGWRFAGWARGAYMISPVARGVSYEVAVVSVSSAGARQRIEDAAHAAVHVLGAKDAPDDPTALAATVTAGGLLHVTATPPDDDTIAGYEIRYGETWGGSVRLARSVAADWTGPCPFVGTETVRVRSINRNGVASTGEVTASVTHEAAASVFTADIDSDEHPGFTGTKTDTVVTGSELALDTGDLLGRYVTADKVAAGTTAQIHLRARCDLADVAMLVEEMCFLLGSARGDAIELSASGPFLDGLDLAPLGTVESLAFPLGTDSMPASLYTIGEDAPDIIGDLTPTLSYDVDTGSGFSGSYTDYTTPPTVAALDGVRARVSLRRPHTRYDPRLVEFSTVTLSTAATAGGSTKTRDALTPVVFWG